MGDVGLGGCRISGGRVMVRKVWGCGGMVLTGLIYGGNIYLKRLTFYFDLFLHTSMRE